MLPLFFGLIEVSFTNLHTRHLTFLILSQWIHRSPIEGLQFDINMILIWVTDQFGWRLFSLFGKYYFTRLKFIYHNTIANIIWQVKLRKPPLYFEVCQNGPLYHLIYSD